MNQDDEFRIIGNDPWVNAYFVHNHIKPRPIYVGMKKKEVIHILGTPTSIDMDWYDWYHNPRGMHVAPYIRMNIENDVVKEIK